MVEAALGSGKTAFVIGPIGDKLDAAGTESRTRYEEGVQMWENVFQPACEAVGLEAIRADKIAAPGEITDQIFVLLRDADVVIADLSGANPNVMYELGLRHSRDLPTIQVGEHGRLPFDINTVRTVQFKRTEAGFLDLRDSLQKAIEAALDGKGSPTSATRVWSDAPSVNHDELAAAAQTSALPDDEDDADEEPSVLDILADGESSLGEVKESLADANLSIVEIGGLASDAAEQLKASDASGKGFAGRVLVARKVAADMEQPIQRFENEIERFYAALQLADAMVRYILRRMVEDPAEADTGGLEFLDQLDQLADTSAGTEVGVAKMAREAGGWKKISRDLRDPGKAIERICYRMIEGITTVTDWKQPVAEARQALEALTDDTEER